MKNQDLYNYILGIADNYLILGQRLGELCGHGPSLEIDIACTNIALDLLGQVRNYYQYAAKISGDNQNEDTLSMTRLERQYVSVLLVEQPNTNFAFTIAKQYLFDVFNFLLVRELQKSADETLAAIAKKAFKEVAYHKRFSADWVKRLGNGTAESKKKMQEAINSLWPYTEELFHQTPSDNAMIKKGIGVDTILFKKVYDDEVSKTLQESTLTIPESKWFHKGGKEGIHTEHFGYILSNLQYMQRTYPNMEW